MASARVRNSVVIAAACGVALAVLAIASVAGASKHDTWIQFSNSVVIRPSIDAQSSQKGIPARLEETFPRRVRRNDIPVVNRALQDLNLKSSSFKCDNKDPVHQICIFENLLMHQGWLMYLVDDDTSASSVDLPMPTLFEVGNTDIRAFTIKRRVRVATKTEFKQLIKATAGRTKTPDVFKLAVFEAALFHRTRSYGHIFWGLNGAGNIFLRLCNYFQVCSPEQIQQAAILSPINVPTKPGMHIGERGHLKAVGDVMECFGPVIGINHPKASDLKPRNAKDTRIFLFKKVLAGIGDVVSEPHSAKGPRDEVRYQRANGTLALERTRYMRRCAGLPADPPPMTKPSILLVNRPHGSGRHIIGLDDVYDQLVRVLPKDIHVRLYYPRAEDIAVQAKTFASANILVVPHGAANANFMFLPHETVIFAVYALPGRHILDHDHAQALPSPPYNLTVVPVDCRGSIQADVGQILQIPKFVSMDAKRQAYLLGDVSMGVQKQYTLKNALGMTSKEWMKFVDYAPDTAALASQIEAVARALHTGLRA